MRSNAESSVAVIKAFAESKGWSDEEVNTFIGKINAAMTDLHSGKVTTAFLSDMDKAYNYNDDVTTARTQGEIKGKNAKITAENDNSQGDMMPNLTGSGESEEKIIPKKTWLQQRLEARGEA